MEATEGNAADVKRLSERVYQIWAALVDSPDVPKPEAGETETNCEQAALAATDAKLLDYAKHDPDVQVCRRSSHAGAPCAGGKAEGS